MQLRRNLSQAPHSGAATNVTNTSHSPLPQPHNVTAPQVQSLRGVRLRRHADYQSAYAAARKRQSASMSWFLAPRPADREEALPGREVPRVGFTAGKVLGKAHERNRIKRRMREAVRRHVELLPAGCDLIFHPRRAVLTMEFAKLEAEIVRILTQANAEAARLQSVSAAPPVSTQ